ncbi:hypothetical protein K470DRAFT_217541 [Piedraia hortae CBS 480.64]|uniref:AA1-like domain-containing protein n=1 Tax=Piedraia hortae CBS 480.64 TaxID=1314780 RepID=A0A6A7BZ31_9PEZI|nr:hypothetical protein K470DRAFT_217541 [Piedraia hortae CBS 480.64]
MLISFLATLVSSARNFAGTPLELTNIAILDDGNTTLSFDVYNPDPLANTRATCGAIWETSSNAYPTVSYKACANSTFGWQMKEFHSLNTFSLNILHTFHDPSVGQPPYDVVTVFAEGDIASTTVPCDANGHSCKQADATVIKATVTAASS